MPETEAPQFPGHLVERLSGFDTMEQYFVEAAKGRTWPDMNLPLAADLPRSLTAGAIDHYAGWICALTFFDDTNNEHGSYFYVRKPEDTLYFPLSATRGRAYDVTPALEPDRVTYYPSAMLHAHPGRQCFSGGFGDVGFFINGLSNGEETVAPPAWIVTTFEHNYALLRTQEAPAFVSYQELEDTAYRMWDPNHFFAILDSAKAFAAQFDITGRKFWRRYNRAEHLEFGNFEANYYKTLVDTFNLAQAYNLGFYVSRRGSGQYDMVTEAIRDELLQHHLKIGIWRAIVRRLPKEQQNLEVFYKAEADSQICRNVLAFNRGVVSDLVPG